MTKKYEIGENEGLKIDDHYVIVTQKDMLTVQQERLVMLEAGVRQLLEKNAFLEGQLEALNDESKDTNEDTE